MSEVSEYTISLRFFGEDLDPDVLSAQLGGIPTNPCCKGDVVKGKTYTRIEKYGRWLKSIDGKPGDSFEPLIDGLLDGLSPDLELWRDLSKRYDGDLYCGIWLGDDNQGMELSPRLMARLAERGLRLGLDIYCPIDSATEEK